MNSFQTATPAARLADLPTESRVIATPWSRMVRGLGLGQHPVDFNPLVASRIRATIQHLAETVGGGDAYTRFARHLTELILDVTGPTPGAPGPEQAIGPVVEALRSERNAYFRVVAGCILIDTVAKLGLDRTLLVNAHLDLPAEVLAGVDEIAPDRIPDDNSGRHGDYEKVSAYTAVFLAFGQIGLQERLISGGRNHVQESLDLLERIPAPFFRGRGASMLLSVLALLGHHALVFDGERDYLKEVLDHLDRADEVDLPPSFPSPMTPQFAKVYPLLTMLNAIAVSGRVEHLHHGRDRLAEAKELMAGISPEERTHMGLYYLVALHNLGRLQEQVPDLDAFVEDVVGRWEEIDPGADFFLRGIAYPYLVQTARFTERGDLLPDLALQRLVDSFPDLDRSAAGRANRPYPVSYVLNALGEIGAADLLFEPRARYGGRSPLSWVIDNLSDGAREERGRLYMLDHALISYALRMRGSGRTETPLFAGFRFGAATS